MGAESGVPLPGETADAKAFTANHLKMADAALAQAGLRAREGSSLALAIGRERRAVDVAVAGIHSRCGE